VTAVDLEVNPPGLERRDVVLVVGPRLAGTSSLIRVLRVRIPDHSFVEAGELDKAHAPVAVVFTVSASAILAESDCRILDSASRRTDLVVGVVCKVDAHHNWREVLVADRALLAQRAPHYTRVPWVGVAAAPDLGEPRVEDLVVLLRRLLADPEVERRNRLRAWESRLESTIARYRADADGSACRARVRALHNDRDGIRSGGRLMKNERAIAVRSQLKQARVELGHAARNRATAMRRELAEDAAQVTRREIGAFGSHARTRVHEAVDDVERGITDHLVNLATGLHLPPPPAAGPAPIPEMSAPPLTSRRQETQLMMILGAGFGLGVALVVTRLFVGIAPEMTVAGLAAGAVVGLVLTVWVVGLRGLLHDRGVLDRWVGDLVNVLRSALEERVATRVLVAETTLCSEIARRDELDSAGDAHRVAQLDAELRALAVQTARANELAVRRLPPLVKALDGVRAELYGSSARNPVQLNRYTPEMGFLNRSCE